MSSTALHPYLNNAQHIFGYIVDHKDPTLLEKGIRDVVREIIPGWQSLVDDDIAITIISGGITNLLYRVSIQKDEKSGSDKDERITDAIVRVYGKNTEVIIERERENDLFAQLSGLQFAPSYLGRFTNGRVEGYLPARSLQPEEMGQIQPIDFCGMIGRELARMHTMPVKYDRTPVLWDSMARWAELAQDITFEDPERQKMLDEIGLDQLAKEMHWLRKHLDGESHGITRAKEIVKEVVFSHQDLLCGNILHAEGWDRVQFIDFEYGGYNYRGFDIGNHFCEHAGYDPDYEKGYPSKAVQMHFLKSYLQALLPNLDIGTDDLDLFLEEFYVVVNRYACAAHLFWGLWAIIQAKYSPIDFDFLLYASQRLKGYYVFKGLYFPSSSSSSSAAAEEGNEDDGNSNSNRYLSMMVNGHDVPSSNH